MCFLLASSRHFSGAARGLRPLPDSHTGYDTIKLGID